MNLPVLSIVIPCFNEEACIEHTTTRLLEVLKELEDENQISSDSFIFFCR